MIKDRLAALRNLMKKEGLDYYLIPSRDAHNSEYVPDCWKHREWISNFSGSAGVAVIGLEKSWLMTDSRYFIQAKRELDPSLFELVRQVDASTRLTEWVRRHCAGSAVGVDPKTISPSEAVSLKKVLSDSGGQLVTRAGDLCGSVRSQFHDRSELPASEAFLWSEDYAGLSAREKISQLRSSSEMAGAKTLILTALDELAWLLNIRGKDIDFNPLVISYGILSAAEMLWFVDEKKCPEALRDHLKHQGVTLRPYESFPEAVRQLKGPVCHDAHSSSQWIRELLSDKSKEYLIASPVALLKARKNETEIKGMIRAHEQDAVALIRFLHWLDLHKADAGTELTLMSRLEAFRRECQDYAGPSFTTISAFAENAAICHYHASEENHRAVDDSSLYLLDSGGQYPYGTTDVTRTIHLGTPDAAQRRYYTLVLKGHLALGHAVFPKGTCGEQLDVLARQFLWREHLNYGHGTGHGVGCYLCVHEGPQRISAASGSVPLEEGMVVSNEPGFYAEDRYGIRIENLCYVTVSEEKESGEEPFLRLMDLTLVPYARNLIDLSLLTPDEIFQVDCYHSSVLKRIGPCLEGTSLDWLEKACEPLS